MKILAPHLWEHGCWVCSPCVCEGRMDMEDCVVKVGVGVGSGSCTQQAFPLSAAQKRHMLHKVGNALLICLLIHTSCTPSQPNLQGTQSISKSS